MRVLVCGGRDFTDAEYLARTLSKLDRQIQITSLIEGDARGADRLAGQWARRNNIPNIKYPADWKVHPKAAGPIRNAKMLKEGRPDIVLAFSGGDGTKDMIDKAERAGVRVIRA